MTNRASTRQQLRSLGRRFARDSLPPRPARVQLKQWGYHVKYNEWLYHPENEWWVGYSTNGKRGICTVGYVTGKLLVEVCVQGEYAEILCRP